MKIPWKWKLDGKWRDLQSRRNSKKEQNVYVHLSRNGLTDEEYLEGPTHKTWGHAGGQPCN